jgi:hypothetical protein
MVTRRLMPTPVSNFWWTPWDSNPPDILGASEIDTPSISEAQFKPKLSNSTYYIEPLRL